MAELLAANQITIAKVLDGEMSAEQLAQLNQASEDASQAKSDVANLEIGGRNMLVSSYPCISGNTKDGYTNYGWASSFMLNDNLVKMLEPSTEYTIRYKYRVDTIKEGTTAQTMNAHGAFLLYSVNGYPYTWLFDTSIDTIAEANSWNVGDIVERKRTFTTPANLHDADAAYKILYYTSKRMQGTTYVGNDKGTFFDIKIEKGNKATDWTPAPEDVEAGIDNAAKVATNYIHSDTTNGLVVNNNQNVGVGYDIQLKADGSNTGMNIRQNGNILASFLQNSVSLGKNSINSKVAMCGDKGGVSASFGYYVDSVVSDNAEMGSTLSFDFNETTFKNKVGQKTGFYEFTYTSADGWELFDPVHDTTSKVTLSQYGITIKTPTSSLNDYAGIAINYVIDGSVKFYNADISNPVRKLELEMAENPSSSESDFANITIERQSGTYASGDGKEHSIITMMTLHEFANVATLELFDDEISLNATHLYLSSSSYGEGSIQLNGNVYVNGARIEDCVVETGSGSAVSGTYNYRMWSSGLSEYWYTIEMSTGIMTKVWATPICYNDYTTWAGLFDASRSGLFTSRPHVTISSRNSQFLAFIPYDITTAGIGKIRPISVNAKSNNPYAFSLYAVGTWK